MIVIRIVYTKYCLIPDYALYKLYTKHFNKNCDRHEGHKSDIFSIWPESGNNGKII